jgi:hypothetical protein
LSAGKTVRLCPEAGERRRAGTRGRNGVIAGPSLAAKSAKQLFAAGSKCEALASGTRRPCEHNSRFPEANCPQGVLKL